MPILHIVNCSPTAAPALTQCLQRMADGDSLLLIEDGVYAIAAPGDWQGRRVYVLESDMRARGLSSTEPAGAASVDYAGFVELAASHDQVLSWT